MEFCPFKGLMPYCEEDERYFFGRTMERRLIQDNLCASRLTVLYGPSGVGKSSVLGAGVVHDLRQDPDYVVVYFGTQGAWLREPVSSLNASLHDRLATLPGFRANGSRQPPSLFPDLSEQLESVDRTLLVILDQFEEYFQYHPDEKAEEAFAHQFPRLLNQGRLPVHFLLSIREDMLAVLDRFKKQIPNLFNNRLRIDFLSREEALEAVLKPLDVFNQEGMAPGPMTIQQGTGERLVELLARVQKSDTQRVQTAYLQLVMESWWHREVKDGSHEMREETLRALGGVETMVDRHLEDTLKQLGPKAEDLAAALFPFMVTPGGRKIAQTTSELAGNVASDYPAEVVRELLQRLRNSRVLTTVPLPRDIPADEQCYEFAHDVMARAAYDWRKHYVQIAETASAQHEAQEARTREKAAHQQAAKLRRLAFSLGAILLLAIVASGLALWEGSRVRRSEHIAREEKQDADRQRNLAEKNLALAQDRGARAERAEQNADRQRSLAEKNLALAQDREAKAQHAEQDASSQRLLAEAGELIRAANSKLDADPELSILLALRADHILRKRQQVPPSLLSALVDGLNRSVQASRVQKTVQLERADDVYNTTISPDRKMLATSGPSGVIKIWDSESGRTLHTLDGDGHEVRSVSFSRDGAWLATADWSGDVKVWEILSEKKRWEMPAPSDKRNKVTGVAFSTGGEQLATGSTSGEVKVWKFTTEPQPLGKHDGAVNVLAFNLKGSRLATAGEDKTIKIWDPQSSKLILTLRGHTSVVNAVAFSDDGEYLASGGGDMTVRLWDLTSGQEIRTLWRGGNFILSLAFDHAGTRLVAGSFDGTAAVWDIKSGRELLSLSGHKGPIQSISFSRDETTLMTGSWDKTLKIWDVPLTHSGSVSDLAFSPNENLLASVSTDSTVKLWDPKAQELQMTLTPSEATTHPEFFSIVFSRDGQFFATVDADQGVRIWDCSTKQQLTPWKTPAPNAFGVSFSPDGTRLVVGGVNNTAEVRDAKTGDLLLTLWGHRNQINDVVFSPDGKLIASASFDWTARVWDSATGETKAVLDSDPTGQKGHKGRLVWVAFSPDSQRLATVGYDHLAKIWNFASDEVLNLSGHTNVIEEVAFSRDGKYVATAGLDGTARIWDAQTGKELYHFVHPRGVESVAFSPDGSRLATGSDDGRVRIFILDREELVRLAGTHVTRHWTADECNEYLHEACPDEPTARP